MRGERGSVLMLFPAAVLIVMLLGAIAVDRAVIFGAQRELVATAQAAASDAAAAGIDVAAVRAGGSLRYDPARIDAAVQRSVATLGAGTTASWDLVGTDVVVRLTRAVDLVFTKAVPGADDRVVVTATARASLVRS
ncbi:hypothetical protein KSP35_06270 [Aquihabitans sp. G128]|uniref:hypothetical protein n=1 Tax=Aquihabitans sp. G128 TaxID=2849779 RepID=UPI001C2111F3|nr:hypothetical protein [Aquihabitans sp. G128]QXC62402.1 hypothetical protein KSP35_06270 [Aquihabitans sp. G128]